MVSEVLIAVAGVMSMALIVVAWYTMFPIAFQLNESDKCQPAFNANAAVICQRVYDIFLIIILVGIGGVFFNLFMRAARRQSDEFPDAMP